MALKTRKPTGKIAPPVILLEGDEGAGKSWAAAQLSASDQVNRTFWLEIGTESTADEYGLVTTPDGKPVRYEIVDHDGTWRGIHGAVVDAKAEAAADKSADPRPDVLVLDTVGAVWGMLSDWANNRAAASTSNKAKLAEDPNAEIDTTSNYWNDATARWRKLMTAAMTFPGIVVLLSRGRETAFIGPNGQPVAKKVDYRVEGQRSLAFDAPVWVRMTRDLGPHTARLVKLRSVHTPIQPPKPGSAEQRNPGRLLPDFTLERLVFDLLKYDPSNADERRIQPLQAGHDAPLSDRAQVLELAVETAETEIQLRGAYSKVVEAAENGTITQDEARQLTALVKARKTDVVPAPATTEEAA